MEDHRDYGTPVEQLDFLLEFVERFLAAVLLSIEQHGTLYRMHGSSWRWPHARKKAEQQADTPKSEDVSPMNRQS